MSRRCRGAVRVPLLLATMVLLCLGMFVPEASAQPEEATPIGGDTDQPGGVTTNDDGDVHSLAEVSAEFISNDFFAFPGTTYAPVYFTISGGNLGITYPFAVRWGDLPEGIAYAGKDSVPPHCPSSPVTGGLNGTYDLSSGITSCQVTVEFSVAETVPPGTSFSLSVEVATGTTVSTATFTVTGPTFAFDQTTYTGKVGTPIEGQFTVTTPAGIPASASVSLGTPFTSLPLSYVSDQATGNTTCDVTHDTSLIYITANATGAGTCTVSFTVGTDSGPTSDPSVVVWANYSGTVEGMTISQIVIEDPVLTAVFGSPTYSAKPGGETTATLTMTTDAPIAGNAYQVFNPYPTLFEYSDPTISGTGGVDCGTPELTDGTIQGSFTATSVSGVASCTLTFTIRALINADTQYPGDYPISAFVAGTLPGPSATFSILAPEAATAVFDQLTYRAAPGESTRANLTITVPDVQFGGTVIIQNLAPDVFTFDNTTVTGETGGVTCDLDVPALDTYAVLHAEHGPGACTISFDIFAEPTATHGEDGDIAVVLLFQRIDPAATAAFVVDDPLLIGDYSFHIQPGTGFNGDLASAVLGGNPPYTFTLVSGPTQGELELNDDGRFFYIANQDATGTDSFTYMVTDANGVDVTSTAQGEGTVGIIFDPVAPSPTVIAPTATERPILPGRTPTPTPTATIGTSGGDTTGGGVTQLPSTGTMQDSSTSGSGLWILLAMGVLLLAGAVITRRRRNAS